MTKKAQKTAINLPLKVAIVRSARFRNQRAFAIAAGISEVRLSGIIHGHLAPTSDEKRAIAKALRCPQAAVFAAPVAPVATVAPVEKTA